MKLSAIKPKLKAAFTSRQIFKYGLPLFFILILLYQLNLIAYLFLLLSPVVILHYTKPELGWRRPLGLGLFLCLFWYLSNVVAFISLAPIGELGASRAISDVSGDLVRYPVLVNKALGFSLYRTRLLLTATGLASLVFITINSPTGRGLGLHRLLETNTGFNIAKNQSQGSARWATEQELRRYLTDSGPGLVIGKNNSNRLYILPYNNNSFKYQRNQNILVFGSTGAGKTASFVKPNLLQADTSFLITDPKGELYASLSPYLKNKGYKIYRLNLIDMYESDCWNPLMTKDGSCNLSVQDAVLIASSIIKNTKDPFEKGDAFWDKAEQALLTALILYASMHLEDPEEKTFANILKFATARDPAALDYDFGKLPLSDPARAAFGIYAQAPEKVKGSVIISLGTRLQLFQDDALARLTSRSDFDLTEPGLSKTAIFVNISDYDSTYNSISALFFTQAFQELYRLAAKHDGELPVFCRFIMDEFCNIGYIPDYTVKLSTMRSRGISAQMIVQSLGQLQNRYPYGQSDEIIGNCDVRLMLGANDASTAKYFTELIGRTTIEQQTHNRSDRVLIDAGKIGHREGARELITPDEILRLDNLDALLIIRGTYPAKIKKIFYKEHPAAQELERAHNNDELSLMREHKTTPPQKDPTQELLSEIGSHTPEPVPNNTDSPGDQHISSNPAGLDGFEP